MTSSNVGSVSIDNRSYLKKLKSLYQNINCENKEKRVEVLNQLWNLCSKWEGPLPNLRDIFQPREIDQLLLDSVNAMIENPPPLYESMSCKRARFIEFVARCGYKDEPIIGIDGKPLSCRTTAVHRTFFTDLTNDAMKKFLFQIYDRYDVNYIDLKTGITHFHVACMYGWEDIVVKFLELGQDPNCFMDRSQAGFSPLHLTIGRRSGKLVQLLLRRGADPNLADRIGTGFTPLHSMAEQENNDDLAKLFFETCAEIQRPVQVDARNIWGYTPLELAVASLNSLMVDVILDHGADLSDFVFPPVSYFGERLRRKTYNKCHMFKLELASSVLIIVENLDRRGYELNRSDALTIMEFFVEYESCEMFEDLDQHQHRWYDDNKFVNKSKAIMMNSSLSLYDLIRLRPEEAEKSLTYTDYLNFACSYEWSKFLERHQKACAEHLCEKLSRGIFRSWAIDSFLKLTNYRFPILCCEMIIDNLKNKDLLNVCLAKTFVKSKVKSAAESKPTISAIYRRRLKKTVLKPPLWLVLKEEEAAAADEAASDTESMNEVEPSV